MYCMVWPKVNKCHIGKYNIYERKDEYLYNYTMQGYTCSYRLIKKKVNPAGKSAEDKQMTSKKRGLNDSWIKETKVKVTIKVGAKKKDV